jgi:UDPglucose--hexose-1-phosphate uridylyltransferase
MYESDPGEMFMHVNEMRKDYILDRWVVIAAQRKRRPTDFIKAKKETGPSVCPFCPGNEHMTPSAIMVYLKADDKIIRDRDRDDFRHKNWLVRCFPNLYPAFAPHASEQRKGSLGRRFLSMDAVGHHEVLVESPNHDEHPGVARVPQLVHVINAYRDRFKALSSDEYVRYVSIFRNHGSEAGASLSHAHTQIIATPQIPMIVKEEMKENTNFWNEREDCVFCDIISKETEGPRSIWESRNFVAFAPWASVHPFEFWIFPKRHQSTILDMNPNEIKNLARAFRVCFGGLNRLLEDPPYNFGFHMVSDRRYHWHLEVYPRLAIWAGFEKSTGMFINVVSPEEAARSLREALGKEEEELA